MIVLSNNKPHRVEPFAKILGLDYIADGAKPLKKGYQRCARALQIPCEQLCMVGDQIFTDIWGARPCGLQGGSGEPYPAGRDAVFPLQTLFGADCAAAVPLQHQAADSVSGGGVENGSKIWPGRKF